MCKSDSPSEPQEAPAAQAFSDARDLLAAIQPGMELCTSDFTGWAKLEKVEADGVRGTRFSDGAPVRVPADALIDIRGGHCVRIDPVKATIDAQGWENPAE